MSKRYGRNQKRLHLKRIAELEHAEKALLERVALEMSAAKRARARLEEAKAIALTEWLNRKEEIGHYRELIAKGLARHYAPELEKHARRILEAAARQEPYRFSPSIEAIPDHFLQETVIRGEIPAIRYNVAVTRW